MWHDGVPYQGQCAGCTFNVWQMKDTAYLTARGVSFAVLTSGRWDEVAPFAAFMGYAQPWYSVRGVEAPIATDEGHIVCYLRDGDRAFLTYRTTGRGNEPADGSVGLLDMTPYGRGKAWEDKPEGSPEGHQSCWYWATTRTGTPPGARPAAPRRSGPGRARPPWRAPASKDRRRPYRPHTPRKRRTPRSETWAFVRWRCRESNPGPPIASGASPCAVRVSLLGSTGPADEPV